MSEKLIKADQTVVSSPPTKSPFSFKIHKKTSLKKSSNSSEPKSKESKDELEANLESDAVNEILRDTQRGATRAEVSGSWRPPSSKVNSRLINNALVQALQSNRRNSQKRRNKTKNHD